MPHAIREPESKVVIRFQDCDPFGHLTNAKYLVYFINAREDHLAQAYGFDLYAQARETKCNWVVTRHHIAYLAPVFYTDEVIIRTSLRKHDEQTVLMEGRMYDKSGMKLKSLLWTEFTYVQLALGRAVKHPPAIQAFLADIRLDEPGFPDDFEARCRAFAKPPAA